MKLFLLITTMWLLLPFGTIAQNNVTQFLGIPIDGFKKDVVVKVKEKGFKHHTTGNYFTGYFYGYPVYLMIESHNRIVNRITLYDIPQHNEKAIRERFNDLCNRFEKSGRYTCLQDKDPKISDKVDIMREMKLSGKIFRAIYRQVSNAKEEEMEQKANVPDWAAIDSIDTKYPIESLKERRRRIHVKALKFVSSMYQGPHKNVVWFAISEKFGKYAIVLVYENLNNWQQR